MFVVSGLLFAVVAVIFGALVLVVADAAVKHDVMMIASDDSVVDVAFSGIYNFVFRLTYMFWFWDCFFFPRIIN